MTTPIFEVGRDSLRSLDSLSSALFELDTPERVVDAAHEFNFDISPSKKAAANGFDADDVEDLPSRKRRASHRYSDASGGECHSHHSLQMEDYFNGMLQDLTNSDKSLLLTLPEVVAGAPVPVARSEEEEQQQVSPQGESQKEQEHQTEEHDTSMELEMDKQRLVFEQERERQRMQKELLSRLGGFDGIELDEEAPFEEVDDFWKEDEQERFVAIMNEDDDTMDMTEEEHNERHFPYADEPRLGVYNQAEREARLNAYREKRKRRVYGKVRYVLRQRVSEARPRVKGRFVKQQSSSDETTSAPRDMSDALIKDEEDEDEFFVENGGFVDDPKDRFCESMEDVLQNNNNKAIPVGDFVEDPMETASGREKRRSAWEMLRKLSIFNPADASKRKQQQMQTTQEIILANSRSSLPTPGSWSSKLLEKRRKSTTGASTASGHARRFSREEFFEYDNYEPQRKKSS